MKPGKLNLTCILLVMTFVLQACSTPAPIVSPQEMSRAERDGTLMQLYEKLRVEKKAFAADSKQAQQLQAQIAQIGNKLALLQQQKVESTLQQQKEQAGLITLASLQQVIEGLARIKDWDAPRYARLQGEYGKQMLAMQRDIEHREKRLQGLGDDQAKEKLVLLHELARMHGGDEGQRLNQRRSDYVADLFNQAVIAIDGKKYEEAAPLLDAVEATQSDYAGLEKQRLRIQMGTFEQHFWDALGAGHPDEAYQLFYQLSLSPGFDMVKDQISQSAGDISNYFVALGKKEQEQKNLSEAYLAFKRANYIRQKLDPTMTVSKDELHFVKLVEDRFVRAQKNKKYEYALGYMAVLEELQPDNSLIKRNSRTLKGQVLEQAAVKLSPSPFSNATQERAFGRGLASKISQYLLAKIPDDIRIIEREQFDMLQKKMKAPGSSSYLAHYYLQGEILDAQVDTSEKTSNHTKRVVTGHVQEPNPDYQKWLALSKGDKKDTPQPPQTQEMIKEEDVTIKATILKKVGVFSAIFRLVDPFTAKVIFVDSVTEKYSVEGESVEGMELGEFKQPAQMTNLLSDSEILEKLAGQVSEKIGDRLVEELNSPELKYAKYAQIAIDEDNMASAVNNYAHSLALALQKELPPQSYEESLKIYVFRADK